MPEGKLTKEPEFNGSKMFKIFLKILAFTVLILGIVFSIFHAPSNLFLMMMFVVSVIVVSAILYTLAVIIGLLANLNKKPDREKG